MVIRELRCVLIRGRFRCQALLDERSILAAMAYVDLNPVRAGIADSLAGSAHTSVAERMRRWTQTAAPVTTPASSAAPEPQPAEVPPDDPKPVRLCAVAGLREALQLPLSESGYVDLVAWSGSVPREGKGCLLPAPAPDSALRHMGCSMVEWQAQLAAIRTEGRAIGGSERMRALAQRLQQCWVQRRRRGSAEVRAV